MREGAPDRNSVYCRRCYKPQEKISVHLARVCMKDHTREEIEEETREAKASTKAWMRTGRTWDYDDLVQILPHRPSRMRMLRALKDRGFFVINGPREEDILPEREDDIAEGEDAAASGVPAPAPAPAPASAPDAREREETGEPSGTPSSSPEPDDRAGDPSWAKEPCTYTKSVRVNMKEAGLYSKFSEDCPLINKFKKYLRQNLLVENCQQEVDNVARVLKYLQPDKTVPDTSFLLKSQETTEYLSTLRKTGMAAPTISNYIKSLMRFAEFLNVEVRLEHTPQADEQRKHVSAYKDFLATLAKPISKATTKRQCGIKYKRMMDGTKTVRECQEVLRVAKDSFLVTYGRFLSGTAVSEKEKTLYRYYCEALLVLRHFQRPGAVEGMMASEWVDRKAAGGRVLVGVSQHKTATLQIATFALTLEEDAWLQTYYEHIRPACVSEGNRPDQDPFFVTSGGKPIRSVTTDIARLHEHYKVKVSTSQEVRRAVETEASGAFSQAQQSEVSHYLAHSTAVAEQHYRMRVPATVVQTAILLERLGGGSSSDPSPESSPPAQAGTSATRDDLADFFRNFPVSVEGKPPTKKERVRAGFADDRTLYDKWRTVQYGQRQDFLTAQFCQKRPTPEQVERRLRRLGWTTNHPTAQAVVAGWKPPTRLLAESDPRISQRVSEQRWRGLVVKTFAGEKGRGVVASTPFYKGDVVCDYHGPIITKEEGNRMMEDPDIQASYLFFFKGGQDDICIDAETFPCACHPGQETYGRLINHSRKRANLKPSQCVLTVDGQQRHCVLFRALRDIKVDEELFFDYGVKRRSFRGEGLDLEWLDE